MVIPPLVPSATHLPIGTPSAPAPYCRCMWKKRWTGLLVSANGPTYLCRRNGAFGRSAGKRGSALRARPSGCGRGGGGQPPGAGGRERGRGVVGEGGGLRGRRINSKKKKRRRA